MRVNGANHLFLPHLGELVQEGEVLRQVFAVGFDAVFHDGQEGLNEAGDAGAAADVLHRTVHVVRAATDQRTDVGGAKDLHHTRIKGQTWAEPKIFATHGSDVGGARDLCHTSQQAGLTCPPSQAAGTGEHELAAASG